MLFFRHNFATSDCLRGMAGSTTTVLKRRKNYDVPKTSQTSMMFLGRPSLPVIADA
jgi:hypothetical protein